MINEELLGLLREKLRADHLDKIEGIFNILIDVIRESDSRVSALEDENAELRASLEHLEKLASDRIDNERKTSRIPPPEHVDD